MTEIYNDVETMFTGLLNLERMGLELEREGDTNYVVSRIRDMHGRVESNNISQNQQVLRSIAIDHRALMRQYNSYIMRRLWQFVCDPLNHDEIGYRRGYDNAYRQRYRHDPHYQLVHLIIDETRRTRSHPPWGLQILLSIFRIARGSDNSDSVFHDGYPSRSRGP